ncbi:hypothetical protein IAT38_007399 [Cryptococcus sp. DSM 104549]
MSSLSLPPLAALFLTHFDDIKGQSVIFYASLPDLPSKTIEHTTLPSGLHVLDSDLVLFTHHDLPGAGVFRSRKSDEGSRGRRMGTLGVVLAPFSDPSDLFPLHAPLADLFDQLEALESSPFAASTSDAPSAAITLLAKVWHQHRADSVDNKVDGAVSVKKEEGGRMERLIGGRGSVPAEHPIAYMPSLLSILGPSIIPVYKAALSGQRILLYSTPPLLPLAAFAWCIWAMSQPPTAAHDAERSIWLGNVGLMDLTELKAREGGWIATTSDVIYRSHPTSYDLFIDLSSIPHSTPAPAPSGHALDQTFSAPTPPILSTYHQPSGNPTSVTYAFSDLPLYRSLLLLSSSPPTVHAGVSKTGGWWLLAFELLERVWRLCVGVCEFAVGKGSVGATSSTGSGGDGYIRLEEGEEDARLLGGDDEDELVSALENASTTPIDDEDSASQEDEAVRQGRLILRQLQHNTYHVHSSLREVLAKRPRGSEAAGALTAPEVKVLAGSRWLTGSGGEARFWVDVARVWGLTVDLD